MSWSRFDDGLDEHRKVEALIESNELRGLAAVGLWTLSITSSNRRLTDGEVSTAALRKLAPRHGAGLAGELVEVRLYDLPGAVHVVHDYLDYNPSRASVIEKRRKDSERKAAGRARAASNKSPDGVHAESNAESNGTTHGVRKESARPEPEPRPKDKTT